MKQKRIRQGQTRWLLNYYPPEYTKEGVWAFFAEKVFVTKTEIVRSKTTGGPFRSLDVRVDGRPYFWGENGFFQRTYENKGACVNKANRLVDNIHWMMENGASNEEIKTWLNDVIVNKEK